MSLFSGVLNLFDARERHLRRGKHLQQKAHFQAASTAYKKAAARGSVEAMLALAALHERGFGTPISLSQALEWFQAAAKQGGAEGHFGAGSCLMRMEQLPRGVRSWFESVANEEPERAGELAALLGRRTDITDPYRLAREHLVQACRQGHAEAHYLLAELFVRGLGGDANAEHAHILYLVAAEACIPGAEYGLGELYRLGEGCDADEETAYAWYRRAAAHNHLPAQFMVAQRLIGSDREEDLIEARRWLEPGSERGAPHADYLMALAILSPAVGSRDVEKGKHHLKRAAAKGHLHAMKQLAQVYDEGHLGEDRDPFEAAGWYKKAAEAGDPEAQFAIGRMYARGEGVPQILSSAARWFAQSAEGGHSLAKFNYALFLERGAGVPPNPELSRALLLAAAEEGVHAAQFKLGRDMLSVGDLEGVAWLEYAAASQHVGALALLGSMHASGEHVPQDRGKAEETFRQAADLGHVPSRIQLAAVLRECGAPSEEVVATLQQAVDAGSSDAELILARMYVLGDGVAPDPQLGSAWLEKAAAHGHPEALFELGVSFCRGDGRPQDLVAGAQYYREAADAGHLIGMYNYAMMVLGAAVEGADASLAKRFLREAANAGLAEAQHAARTYQVILEESEDWPAGDDHPA